MKKIILRQRECVSIHATEITTLTDGYVAVHDKEAVFKGTVMIVAKTKPCVYGFVNVSNTESVNTLADMNSVFGAVAQLSKQPDRYEARLCTSLYEVAVFVDEVAPN